MSEEDTFKNLANAIVIQAVADWRAICRGKKIPGESLDSIRCFFNSEWCQRLCGRLDPLYVLATLEKELESIA